jgi:hypothetical protein
LRLCTRLKTLVAAATRKISSNDGVVVIVLGM